MSYVIILIVFDAPIYNGKERELVIGDSENLAFDPLYH